MAQDKHGPDANAVEIPTYFTQQSNVKWVEMQQFHLTHRKQWLQSTVSILVCLHRCNWISFC